LIRQAESSEWKGRRALAVLAKDIDPATPDADRSAIAGGFFGSNRMGRLYRKVALMLEALS
jgi:hypothetical protein